MSRTSKIGLALAMAAVVSNAAAAGDASLPHRYYEGLPPKLIDSVAKKHQQVIQAASNHPSTSSYASAYALVKRTQRWKPAQTVRVAFLGGTPSLYARIESAANQWTAPDRANLHWSFRDNSNNYRTWTVQDVTYSAEIRIAFAVDSDSGSYWSLVGTDSTDPTISASDSGGRSNQASLNLAGFDQQLPEDWEAVTLHELGHALGLEHEHQARPGGCDFRFEDEAGYQLSHDKDGWVSKDDHGRFPGLYTYLGGPPNKWPKERVDNNLREFSDENGMQLGPFDVHSIMMYSFPDFFFIAGSNSACSTQEQENAQLSNQDITGVRVAYPSKPQDIATVTAQRTQALERIQQFPSLNKALKAHLEKLDARTQ